MTAAHATGGAVTAEGFGTYANTSRQMIQMINRLRDTGAAYKIDLPAVAVCGNQSAGKSSVLERLCGIQLPRAAGTCTKCPTEVRLRADEEPWSCEIKLRREFDRSGTRLPSPEETQFAKLGEAARQGGELAKYIRAAQRALLNPSKNWNVFAAAAAGKVDSDDADEARDDIKFTRNMVVLEVCGASVDLTVIDLPGIIQSDEDNPENKEIVLNMVKDFISQPRTLIVAAVSCKDDINNQAIVDLAREVDPEGKRTVGVLTKPDTIEAGTHDHWLPILQGEKFRLDLGYHVVKNPTQKELDKGISAEMAVQKESRFFDNDPFWGADQLAALRPRFGVDGLRRELSVQLVRVVCEELPKMRKAVHESLQAVDRELQRMQPALSNESGVELQRLVALLRGNLQAAQRGVRPKLMQSNSKVLQQFRGRILTTRPFFYVGGEKKTADEGDPADYERDSFWLEVQPMDKITLEDVGRIAEEGRVRELPGFVPYSTLDALINRHKGAWDIHIDDAADAVAANLEEVLLESVEEVFGRFPAASVAVRLRLMDVFNATMDKAKEQLGHLKQMEGYTMTLNDHYYLSARESFNTALRRRHYGSKQAATAEREHVDAALGALAMIGLSGLKREDLFKLIKDHDGVAHLLNMAAATLAYFKVASKRVIDAVPMNLQLHLIDRFVEEAERALHLLVMESTTAATGSEGTRAEELLREDRRTAEVRAKLEAQRRMLGEAQKILNSA